MKLSMDMIADALGEWVLMKKLCGMGKRIYSYAKFCIGEGAQTLKEHVLVCTKEQFWNLIDNSLERLDLICIGIPKEREEKDIHSLKLMDIIFVKEMDPWELINRMGEIFARYQNLDQEFQKMIYHGAPEQQIIDYATEIVRAPLCLMDMNHNAIATSSNIEHREDALWDVLKNGYGYKYMDIIRKSEPKLRVLADKKMSAEGLSNISGQYIKVSILYRKNRAIGALGMHKVGERTNKFEKYTLDLYEYIYEMLTEYFRNYQGNDFGKKTGVGKFVQDVIERRTTDEREIDACLEKLKLKSSNADGYQMAILYNTEKTWGGLWCNEVLSYLDIVLRHAEFIEYKGCMIMLMNKKHISYLGWDFRETLSGILKKYRVRCIISNPFDSFLEMPYIYEIIQSIRTLSEKAEGPVIFAADYMLEYMINLMVKDGYKSSYLHPVCKKLLKNDKKYGTEYLETLKVYLATQCDVQDSADLLHIHRNSFCYRLRKIEELLGMELKDNKVLEELMFAFKCLQ